VLSKSFELAIPFFFFLKRRKLDLLPFKTRPLLTLDASGMPKSIKYATSGGGPSLDRSGPSGDRCGLVGVRSGDRCRPLGVRSGDRCGPSVDREGLSAARLPGRFTGGPPSLSGGDRSSGRCGPVVDRA